MLDRVWVISSPEFLIAVRSRSLLSLTEVVGSPTRMKARSGVAPILPCKSTSTTIGGASNPVKAAEWACAILQSA